MRCSNLMRFGAAIWGNIAAILKFYQSLKKLSKFRLHDSDLGPARTFAVRRLRSSSFDSQAPWYLNPGMTAGYRKRTGQSREILILVRQVPKYSRHVRQQKRRRRE